MFARGGFSRASHRHAVTRDGGKCFARGGVKKAVPPSQGRIYRGICILEASQRRPKGVPGSHVNANGRDDLGVATGKNILRAEGVKKPSHRPKAVFTEGADFQG